MSRFVGAIATSVGLERLDIRALAASRIVGQAHPWLAVALGEGWRLPIADGAGALGRGLQALAFRRVVFD